MSEEEDGLKDFLTDHNVVAPSLVKPGGRQVKKALLQGAVEAVSPQPNPGGLRKTRLMKVVTIERDDQTRVAHIDLRVQDGSLIKLEIDEATASALYQVFQPSKTLEDVPVP